MDPGESYGKLLATLAANRKLQSRLQEIMDTAESMLLGVADMQAKLKLLSATENRTGSYSGQRRECTLFEGQCKPLESARK